MNDDFMKLEADAQGKVTALPGPDVYVLQLGPDVYVLQLGPEFYDPSTEEIAKVREKMLALLPEGSSVIVLPSGMTMKAATPYSVTTKIGELEQTITFASHEEMMDYLDSQNPTANQDAEDRWEIPKQWVAPVDDPYARHRSGVLDANQSDNLLVEGLPEYMRKIGTVNPIALKVLSIDYAPETLLCINAYDTDLNGKMTRFKIRKEGWNVVDGRRLDQPLYVSWTALPPAPDKSCGADIEQMNREFAEMRSTKTVNEVRAEVGFNAAKPDNRERCEKCGWPLYGSVSEGCTKFSCSQRNR